MEVEDACEIGGCGGACLMGAVGSRITRGGGGRDRNCCDGSWREKAVDLPCVNKVKAVQVGQDVGCLLK